jgi:hypothetical protein
MSGPEQAFNGYRHHTQNGPRGRAIVRHDLGFSTSFAIWFAAIVHPARIF